MDILSSLSSISILERALRFVVDRFTHWGAYQQLDQIETGLNRRFVEQEFDQPIQVHGEAGSGCEIAYYSDGSFILKLVYGDNDQIQMFSITALGRGFKMPFSVAGDEYRLGDIVFADFGPCSLSYADFSSKDVRYGESRYLANPGGYQHLLLALHQPPGPQWSDAGGVIDLARRLPRPRNVGKVPDELREDWSHLRKSLVPNAFGFARRDEYTDRLIGPVYQHVRPILRAYN